MLHPRFRRGRGRLPVRHGAGPAGLPVPQPARTYSAGSTPAEYRGRPRASLRTTPRPPSPASIESDNHSPARGDSDVVFTRYPHRRCPPPGHRAGPPRAYRRARPRLLPPPLADPARLARRGGLPDHPVHLLRRTRAGQLHRQRPRAGAAQPAFPPPVRGHADAGHRVGGPRSPPPPSAPGSPVRWPRSRGRRTSARSPARTRHPARSPATAISRSRPSSSASRPPRSAMVRRSRSCTTPALHPGTG